MAEEPTLDAGSILRRYYAQFGDAGDFDRFLLPPEANLHLMDDALKRGTPVTQAEVCTVYKVLTGEDYCDPGPDAER